MVTTTCGQAFVERPPEEGNDVRLRDARPARSAAQAARAHGRPHLRLHPSRYRPRAQEGGRVMGIFTRGNTLWMRFRDVDGRWRNESTGVPKGQEALAEEALAKVEAHVASLLTPTIIAKGSMMTLRAWAKKW